jgi:glucoamylase
VKVAPGGQPDSKRHASPQLSADFLQLVRLGLRQASDRLICDSFKVVDNLPKVDTHWARVAALLGGYGEHADGRSYDGTGKGRPWPLLAGERGPYELAAGRDPLSSQHGPVGRLHDHLER